MPNYLLELTTPQNHQNDTENNMKFCHQILLHLGLQARLGSRFQDACKTGVDCTNLESIKAADCLYQPLSLHLPNFNATQVCVHQR